MHTKIRASLAKLLFATIPALGLLTFSIPTYAGISWTTMDDPNAVFGTYPRGISGSNFVGSYLDSQNNSHGFINSGGSFATLDFGNNYHGAPVAAGISGSNVVGWYSTDNFLAHGFLFNGSSFATLDAPFLSSGSSGVSTMATGIDGSNVVGFYLNSGNAADLSRHGFLYNGVSYTDLTDPFSSGTNGSAGTRAFGISGSNVVGDYTDISGNYHGFLYNGSTYVTLDDPNGIVATHAFGINGSNIVGSYTDSTQHIHGFLYNGTSYTTLDDPSVNSGGSTEITGISGSTIVGYYSDSTGYHGFIATGVPEPSSIAMLSLGTLLFAARRRRRKEQATAG